MSVAESLAQILLLESGAALQFRYGEIEREKRMCCLTLFGRFPKIRNCFWCLPS